jgi:hypothetical protein
MRPCSYEPATSIFSGMTPEQLRAQLADAQAAYLRRCTGDQGVSYSYTQGDGTKFVTYTAANMAGLVALIRQPRRSLGIVCRARSPVRFMYR